MEEKLEINGRKHNQACENAHIKKCSCSCNGLYHSIKDQQYEDDGSDPIGVNMGGEIEIFIRKYLGRKYRCLCDTLVDCSGYVGYPDHDGGLADKDGRKWWVYIVCEKCRYAMAFWKIDRRLV